MKIIKSNEREAILARTHGWIAGCFMDDNHPALTEAVEVKLWRYQEPFEYGWKKFDGTELIVINGGRLRIEAINSLGEKETITLDGTKVEYVVLPQGITKTVILEEAPAFGVTVRWPSVVESS